MKQAFTISATLRGDKGKGASRRLRHANKVPGIVYGANKEPTSITIEHNSLLQLLANESSYTKILSLDIAGHEEQVVLRDLQRHPFKPRILHLDLQRISTTEKISMRIPLHFTGSDIAPGVKVSGGLISRLMSDIEVRCLPKYLPEFIGVDLSKLEINQTIHLSNLNLPPEIEIVALAHGEDKPVATAYIPRAVVEETAAPVSAEVPVVGKEEEGKEGEASTAGEEKAASDSKKAPADKDKKGK